MENSKNRYQRSFDCGSYSGFQELLDAKIFTDDGSSFDVHKLVLAKQSKFFQAMFCGIDKGKKEYKISNFDGNCLSEILTYIYTKRISVTEQNIDVLLIAADYFSLKHLYVKVKLCVRATITHANSFKLVQTAYSLNDNEILRYCLKFITTRFEKILRFQKSDIEDFPTELLKCILDNVNLNVKNENTVWKTIVHWVQTCPESRLKHVISLISTLAIREIDENLAIEIINHDIIVHNIHMESLINLISSFDRKCEVLSHILTDFKPKDFRIPQNLNIIFRYNDVPDMEIFITYDETHDLWRKITDVPNCYPRSLIAVGSKVYIFEDCAEPRCLNLNLKTMEWKFFQSDLYKKICSLLTIESCLYILIRENETYNIEIFDPETNKRLHITSLENFDMLGAIAIVIEKNIFVVGVKCSLRRHVTQIFNVVTRQWTTLSSPKKFHDSLDLVAYHNKIYLIEGFSLDDGHPKVEVFDFETKVWKELPDIDVTYSGVCAMVSNDQLIMYDYAAGRTGGEIESTAVVWNEIKECWEELEKKSVPEDMRWYGICTVDDTETIKILTKLNRDPTVEMEKSTFFV